MIFFSLQTKGDLKRAEEYYSRAILADSEDGEILSQYASLIWELHRDEGRAMSYFEQAVRAASEDRYAFSLVSYNSFIYIYIYNSFIHIYTYMYV